MSDKNLILGIDSRTALLRSLGQSLLEQPDVFGDQGRPGNLVGDRRSHHNLLSDYMIKTAENPSELHVHKFWDDLQTLLIPVWPKNRTTVKGFAIGDA